MLFLLISSIFQLPLILFLNKNMLHQLSNKSFHLLRRSYAVAAENMKLQAAASAMRKATELRAEVSADEQKETFWMKDPKTGNWMPEDRFDDIDVAELREKFLSKKHK